MLITHEMSVARAVADEVAVMEAGRLIEHSPVGDVLVRPRSAGLQRLVAALRRALPRGLRAALSAAPAPGHDPVLQIDVLGKEACGPLLARLSAALGAEPTLLHGGIDHVQDQPFGRLYVSLRGQDGDTGPTIWASVPWRSWRPASARRR